MLGCTGYRIQIKPHDFKKRKRERKNEETRSLRKFCNAKSHVSVGSQGMQRKKKKKRRGEKKTGKKAG